MGARGCGEGAAGEPKDIRFEPDVGHADFDEVVPLDVYEERLVNLNDRNLLEATAFSQ